MKDCILITGGSGLLALNWAAIIRGKFNVILGLHERIVSLKDTKSFLINLDSKQALAKTFEKLQPQLVIHTAGLTSVEQCEANPAFAKYVNVDLTRNLVMVCADLNIPLVYISSDHLFSGNESFVSEDFSVLPLNVYARTKAEAENYISETHTNALIIRTNFYAWGPSYRNSFSDMIINNLRGRRKITLFKDVYYTPILVESLVQAVHDLVQRKFTGIFNVVGDDRISKYDFGLNLAKVFNLDTDLIDSGKISDCLSLVQRPFDMSLSNQKVSESLNRKIGGIYQHILQLKAQEEKGLKGELRAL